LQIEREEKEEDWTKNLPGTKPQNDSQRIPILRVRVGSALLLFHTKKKRRKKKYKQLHTEEEEKKKANNEEKTGFCQTIFLSIISHSRFGAW